MIFVEFFRFIIKRCKKILVYDLFISHSSLDKNLVREIVKRANDVGVNCYIDWTADNDFLKRSMVSEYTKEKIKLKNYHIYCQKN